MKNTYYKYPFKDATVIGPHTSECIKSKISLDLLSLLGKDPLTVLIHTCKRELSPAHLVCPWRHNA
jgi:hypothetical protein